MKIEYYKMKECHPKLGWLFHSWSFWTASSKRLTHETGFRIFGWTFIWERGK